MKFISNGNIVEDCKKKLLRKYNINKIETNVLKRIDFEGVFLLWPVFFMLIAALFMLSKIIIENFFNYSFSWAIVIIFSGIISFLISFFVNYVNELYDKKYDTQKAEEVSNACLNFNQDEFMDYLKHNFYQKYCELTIFDLLSHKKAGFLSATYKDKNTYCIRYDDAGLVKELSLCVDQYEYRTDIDEDELLLDTDGKIIYRKKYNKNDV